MPINRIAVGTPGEASHPDAIRAAFAEFFSMLIFVFAGEGSGMAFSKILQFHNFNISVYKIVVTCHDIHCSFIF